VPTEHIQDVFDPRLADYGDIPDPVLLREHGVFVAEGRMVVRALLEERRFTVRSLLVSTASLASLEDLLANRPELPVYVAGADVLARVVGFNVHRGCLAVGERPAPLTLRDALAASMGSSLVVVAERVGNADNIGGIFRNAKAFGAGCVFFGPDCCDPLYRKAIRVSMGASLRLPFAEVPDWPHGLAGVKAAGFEVAALTPRGDAEEILSFAASRRGRTALLLGHEGHGLTDAALAMADRRVRIAMSADVDSINVAAAAGIAMYLCTRGGRPDL
jgi:tRNA G18 (ribose-2'-O)-methylase SpoU